MFLTSDQLGKLKRAHFDGKKREKTDTITFLEAYKRCRRYISARDEGGSMRVGGTYADKKRETLETIDDFVDTLSYLVDGYIEDTDDLKRALKDEIVNYGILTHIIDKENEDIDELQINSLTEIFYVEKGRAKRLNEGFNSNGEVKKIIEKLIEKGERLNNETPFINARTGDGFRLNVTHPSISKNGYYSLTLRKQKKDPINERDILRNETITKNMLDLMKLFPRGRVNWSTVGSTGSGKTVLNNVLLPFLNPGLRSIFIENPTELRPEIYDKEGRVINNFLQLEAKNVDAPTPTDPTMYNLLVNALRQTPDYIVPGEVRSPQEFEVALSAAQTGHNVFTTYHAEDPEDAIFRFLNAVLKVSDAPAELIMRDICAAFRFIINVKRLHDGSRRVMYISEIKEPTGLKVNITHIYKFLVDRVEETIDEATGQLRPIFHGRHVRLNPISPWFQEKLQQEGVPRERFELFTTEPEKLRDEQNRLIYDEYGNEIVLEQEFEYRNKRPELNMEKLLQLHNARLARKEH